MADDVRPGEGEDVLARIADGEPINWERLATAGAAEGDPAWAEAIRLIAAVASANRAVPDLRPADGISGNHLRHWGKYVLTDRLGAGSFGEVYHGWDPSLRREVAIKVLHPSLTGGETVGDRLLEEGQRLASVRHTNIVSVFEVEQHEGRLGLCMEFVRGRTLEEVVRLQGTLGALEAARVGIAVCGALSAVHRAGLVHRDVKPNNVMREESGRIVLMDFGSGMRALAPPYLARAAVGTPLYMAPELLDGATATPSTDVYSVGVLLYFLVSGRHPIEGRSLKDIRAAHARGMVKPVAEQVAALPAGFVEALNRALSRDPDSRYVDSTELAADLEALVRALERRRTLSRAAALVAGIAAGSCALVMALGFVTSATYWFLLGIGTPFVTEGWTDHFIWGLRSLVAPGAMAGAVTGTLYLALECFALAQKVSTRIRRFAHGLSSWARRLSFARQIGLRDRARLAVLASVAVIVWIPTLGFPEFVGALLSQPLATAPEETLQLLGPPGVPVQDQYRQGLSAAVTLMCVVWMTIWRGARREGTQLGSAGWLGLGCVLATLVLLEVPYRIVHHTYAERAVFQDSECYVTARSDDAVLLFCPQLAPRVFSVSKGDSRLVLRRTVGKLFESIK